ncbi:MAG: cyclopropane-fatty-acyl-phospholipid synthase [Oryzomonas sp.]|uniref:cyclopropane-fatty-acyl-phospholipid synthase family protein n=1 Tax=Oryzomonas sp. TaxID=2855186 RepID=UPI002840C317|nr:cyclopropane-fatty-acyl-phospholipid synthase family protein [Oryzomonas sp.]MDR3579832.1 cyclopropane-fatty-acyl-phospholipid synthase [Oryzomonas sp.]
MKVPKPSTCVAPFSCNSRKEAIGRRVYGTDTWLARRFLQTIGDPPLLVTLWDDTKIAPPGSTPAVGMIIRDRGALLRLLSNPQLHFGDDYCTGRIEIEGGLAQFMETVYRAMGQTPRFRRTSEPAAYRRHQPHLNSLEGSRQNIHHHYDIGNDFYRLWLDDEMLYTCAYFPDPNASLEAAQIAKMDLVCRKLCLRPGQTVVEAGCGWGALARHMARHYGAIVKAYNISHEQIAYSRERAKLEGLEGRVEYVEDDYRAIAGTYDAFVSVGMLEHVGPDHYQELGGVIERSLTEQGLGLIHTIGQNVAAPLSPWFLKRIFPGSYPPTLREMMALFEPFEFTILDVENLRLHYAKTCENWLDRFEQNRDQIREMFDERFIRAWRLYLSGCVANFSIGELQLFQVVFSRPGNNRIHLTRSHMIADTGVP